MTRPSMTVSTAAAPAPAPSFPYRCHRNPSPPPNRPLLASAPPPSASAQARHRLGCLSQPAATKSTSTVAKATARRPSSYRCRTTDVRISHSCPEPPPYKPLTYHPQRPPPPHSEMRTTLPPSCSQAAILCGSVSRSSTSHTSTIAYTRQSRAGGGPRQPSAPFTRRRREWTMRASLTPASL